MIIGKSKPGGNVVAHMSGTANDIGWNILVHWNLCYGRHYIKRMPRDEDKSHVAAQQTIPMSNVQCILGILVCPTRLTCLTSSDIVTSTERVAELIEPCFSWKAK